MVRPIQLTLHLGVHKTATTHLQRTLTDNHELLIANGVRSYEPEYLRQRGRSIPNMFGLEPWAKKDSARRIPENQLEFLAKGSKRVLLSEENFLGPLHDGDGKLCLPVYYEAAERIAALVDALPHARVRIFLSIRRPDTFLNSAYSQMLFADHVVTPDAFRIEHPVSVIDWFPLVRDIAAIEGVESLTLWRYEDYNVLFPEIIRRLTRWKLARKVKPFERTVNQSLSRKAVALVMDWHAAGRSGMLARKARNRYPVTDDNPRFALFDAGDAAAATVFYDAQVAAIAALPKVEFLFPYGEAAAGA